MNGDTGWSGVCGVPGLGCSVQNKYNYVPALQLWELHTQPRPTWSKQDKHQQSQSQKLGDKIVSMFGLKRRNTMKAPESVVSLPKVSVRRSNTISSVTPKIKSGPAVRDSSDQASQSYICRSCVTSVTSVRPGLARSLSCHSKKEAGSDRSLSSSHRRLQKKKVGSTKTERCESKKAICQSRATQTEPEQYDYAYSFSESRGPAVTDEGEEGNIYEEITETATIPPHRRLFFNISQGRRDNLEMYKFADWDLEDKLRPKIDKDNYIKPTEIKSSLSKKSSLRKMKTKEQRVVTFAGEDRCDGRGVQRSRSLHVSHASRDC